MSQKVTIKAPYFIRLIFKEFDDVSLTRQTEQILLFFFSTFMMFGALVWGFLCLVYGYRMPSLIPFGYVVMTLFNFLIFSVNDERMKFGVNFQIATSIVLPFVFQYALGGIAVSGMVMLWSLLALLGSLILQEIKMTYIWMGLYVGLTIGSFVLESTIPEETLMYKVPLVVCGVNILLISILIYGFAHFSKVSHIKLQNMLYESKRTLKTAKAEFNLQLDEAQEFTETIFSQGAIEDLGYRQFQVRSAINPLNGNFTWTGEYGNKKIVVVVDNPCAGVRGGFESMYLKSLIESAVFQIRVKAPEKVIEYIVEQSEDSTDSMDLREGMEDIGVAVFFHDVITNQLHYAVQSTTCIIGNSLESKVISNSSALNDLPPGFDSTALRKGEISIEPGMRLVVANDAMVINKKIEAHQELLDSNLGFGNLLIQDLGMAEKKLNIAVSKFDTEEDIFLQCLEF